MLLLLDIDGTLVRGAAVEHAAALLAGIAEVHGVRGVPMAADTAGRTDGWIVRDVLLRAGVDARRIDDGAEAVRAASCAAYARLVPDDLSDKVIPGVPAALERLQADGHTLALVTGNYEPIAKLKLSRAGIGRHIDWHARGGFGSDSDDRSDLPPIARRRAGSVPRTDAVVIGDTPHDVACARADAVKCIAVLTGKFGREDLAGADEVVGSLADVPALLA